MRRGIGNCSECFYDNKTARDRIISEDKSKIALDSELMCDLLHFAMLGAARNWSLTHGTNDEDSARKMFSSMFGFGELLINNNAATMHLIETMEGLKGLIRGHSDRDNDNTIA